MSCQNGAHFMNLEEAQEDVEGIRTMRFPGRNTAKMLKRLDSARQAGTRLPEQEKATVINFIR